MNTKTPLWKPKETGLITFLRKTNPDLLELTIINQCINHYSADRFKADWNDHNQKKYYVCYDYIKGEWDIHISCYTRIPGLFPCSKKTANTVVEILNNNNIKGITSSVNISHPMSACIDSGIDCEFRGVNGWIIDKLVKIENGAYYTSSLERFRQCKPRMGEYIHASENGWDKCPIPKGYNIQYHHYQPGGPIISSEYLNLYWETIYMFKILGETQPKPKGPENIRWKEGGKILGLVDE
ncbi:MAG: hypothetical protein GY928_20860 [Colwellia sp.]|nr:hypothetical protein [Colwellia sp.]